MPTIFGRETANVALFVAAAAFLTTAGGLFMNIATYYKSYISYNPLLSARFDINHFQVGTIFPNGNLLGDIVGKIDLYNDGNKVVEIMSFAPILIEVNLHDSAISKALINYPALENIPALKSTLQKYQFSGGSFRYEPDITKQDIQDIYVNPSQHLNLSWNATVGADKIKPGSDYIFVLKIIAFGDNNTPVLRIIPGAMIHYNGPRPDGIIDDTCFSLSFTMLSHKII